jgi:predicted transposase YdaD
MGIEEAILQEVRETSLEQGLEQGLEKLQQSKIKGIQKALSKGKLNLEEIADLFEVSLEFVTQVQSGDVK